MDFSEFWDLDQIWWTVFFFPDKNPEGKKKTRKIVRQGGRKEDICDNRKKTIPLWELSYMTSSFFRHFLTPPPPLSSNVIMGHDPPSPLSSNVIILKSKKYLKPNGNCDMSSNVIICPDPTSPLVINCHHRV